MGGVLIVGMVTTKLFIRLTRDPTLPALSWSLPRSFP
jgi:hypothetical protein